MCIIYRQLGGRRIKESGTEEVEEESGLHVVGEIGGVSEHAARREGRVGLEGLVGELPTLSVQCQREFMT